ncbi:MAG: PD-(D/E)XK nuclease family protein [Bacilli bacterium]|nr:PD-(D/E)XK nuclease family protein [Bacilli bacterium]
MEKIILAPSQMHKNILSYCRKDDIFANPKLLTKEELLEKFYGRVTDVGTYYLYSKKDFKYDNLLKILPYIPRTSVGCQREKNINLYNLKAELEKEKLIDKDEFFDQFIKNKEIEIYGYDKTDKELITLLNKFEIPHRFISFSKGNNELVIKKFSLIEDEVFYMLNEIAKLLDSGVSPEDVYIYTKNENALFYIKRFYDSFGYKVNLPNDVTIYSQESVAEFLSIAKITESFELAFEFLKDPNVFIGEDILELLVDVCSIELPFEKKYDYVSSYLKTRKIARTRYENAVNVVSGPIFVENKHIFIPCFAQNIFPKSFKDVEYVSDAEKRELGVLTSLEECRIEDSISKAFLLSNNKFYLSRSSASINERYFPSPFVKSLGIIEVEVKDLPDTIYSKKYGSYRLGLDKDNELYFLQYSKCMESLDSQLDFSYRDYDNSYTNAEAISETDFLKFSYTSIKTYYECPFAYYLNSVLKISTFEDNFNTKFGTVAHYVFEHQYDPDFNFEEAFEKARSEQKWEPDEELFVDKLKEDIRHASNAAILHYTKFAEKPEIKTELNLHTYIKPNTLLEGKIDKAMILDGSDAILVDYKTGKEGFKKSQLEYGLSMQLPTYAYLFSTSKEFKDYHITGLYINNVINRSFTLEKGEDELIDSYLKLNGVTVADLQYVSKIDSSIINGKSLFISGLSQKGGKFKNNSYIVGDEEMKQMQDIVLDKYLEVDRKIRNNEFEIAPLFVDANDPCKYCEHRDICFVRDYQKRGKKEEEDESNGN